ncbi:MAG: hypothetical protein EBS33_05020, partial [Alphaproteobacteria bacterium]|nr:hypothetical protein [Alphaproteobacteria bacterium]
MYLSLSLDKKIKKADSLLFSLDNQQFSRNIKLNNFDLIIHFAAIVPVNKVNSNYDNAKNVNYFGTQNLINS